MVNMMMTMMIIIDNDDGVNLDDNGNDDNCDDDDNGVSDNDDDPAGNCCFNIQL